MKNNINGMANAFFCRSDVSIKGENESVAKPIKNISKYFDRLLPKMFLLIKYNGTTKRGNEILSIIFDV
jgi:hypothetical protein